MKIGKYITYFLFLTAFSHVNGARVLGARHPAPSPDGSKIAFSYYGDIWIVDASGGRAERLTVNPAYEGRPYWSPDGNKIAFMTDRWGNDEICVMPSDGSAPPKRLTFHSNYDLLYGWSPDGNSVIFVSQRHTLRPNVYRVSIEGGTPYVLMPFEAYNPNILPDGKIAYFERGGAAWWRRRYKGGANQDIWKKTLPNGISRQITNYAGRDTYPMYSQVDSKLYFISDRGEDTVSNIWRMEVDGTNPEQMTFETEEIHFPRISFDGSLISYECLNDLCTYNVRTEEKKKLQIWTNEDYTTEPFTFETFASDASEFVLSPTESELAFVVHGDIFVMQIKDGTPDKVVQVTNTPYLEKDVAWHPEKEMLIYAAMEDGDMDIFTVAPRKEKKFYDDLVFTTQKILDTENTIYRPTFSPNGEMIAYLKNHGELHVMDKDSNNNRKLCTENDVLWLNWAPDSRWLTFSRTALGWREDVFIVDADCKEEPVNISNHPNDDYMPMWSQDGKRIAFASRDAVGNLWMKYVFLLKEDEERDQEYWEKSESDTIVVAANVFIDFDDIGDRIHTVTQVRGGYNRVAQSPDGRQFAIHSNNLGSDDIWTVDWMGKELKRVTLTSVDPKMFSVSRDRKKIHYLSRSGQIFTADIASTQSAPLSFRVRLGIDKDKERHEVMKHAWWSLQDGFYDSDFHGTDWRAMYDKYAGWAEQTRETRDFHDVIRMMMGELNASHLGVWKSGPGGIRSGAIGIIPDPSYTGAGIRVKDVIPNTPATEIAANIKAGEHITHINGEEIGVRADLDELLRDMANKDVLFTIKNRERTREIKIKPQDISAILQTVNTNWIRANRDHVHAKSSDRIGYLYIASMDEENLRKFEKDLYEEMHRDGLIIDIRYNGGGSIHDELINILRRTAYAYSIERGGQKAYSSLFRWDKPTALLINDFCYSDAEIFPAAFKELELGTVVGVPTFGAVIGTVDIQLYDGTYFRVPTTGWYLLTGENLENTPVEPDIYVQNPPEEDGTSSDRQLTKAIEVLLDQISQ
ncbi:MAG: PD40 domain-containing protein [candidate division WOR-3 bacterium]|nr:MAG: PD40 domain-containing protein [candidate division WOR-3 bacterium]